MTAESLASLVSGEQRMQRLASELEASMAPAGTLGLHPLVDQRRLEYGIPNGVFTHVAMYDRIIVVQVPERKSDTFLEGGVIVKTQRQKDKDTKETPRGIIVSAGLEAQDQLVSHGCGLGHIVRFIRNAPYRFEVDQVGDVAIHVMLLRAGDIVSSEDLQQALQSGRTKVVVKEATVDGILVRSHMYVDETGQTWNPVSPWISDDT